MLVNEIVVRIKWFNISSPLDLLKSVFVLIILSDLTVLLVSIHTSSASFFRTMELFMCLNNYIFVDGNIVCSHCSVV